jgi:hypothetical protein
MHNKTICQLGFRYGQQSSQPATTASGLVVPNVKGLTNKTNRQ